MGATLVLRGVVMMHRLSIKSVAGNPKPDTAKPSDKMRYAPLSCHGAFALARGCFYEKSYGKISHLTRHPSAARVDLYVTVGISTSGFNDIVMSMLLTVSV